MGTRVPQADLSVIATGEELRLARVDRQTPQLISVTLEEGGEFLPLLLATTSQPLK